MSGWLFNMFSIIWPMTRKINAKEMCKCFKSHWQVPAISLKPGCLPLALDIRSTIKIKHFVTSPPSLPNLPHLFNIAI